jgi:hypothetical protein
LPDGYLHEIYQRIEDANSELTSLLEGTGYFNQVLRGYPENITIYQGTVATSYMVGLGFEHTMGRRNYPKNVGTIIGIITRGTVTEAHDEIVSISLHLLEKFLDSEEWITINGKVRDTEINDFAIYPEKAGNVAITTAIMDLQHGIDWRGV